MRVRDWIDGVQVLAGQACEVSAVEGIVCMDNDMWSHS